MRTTLRRTAIASSVVAIGLSLLVATAPQASAATCPTGHSCFWSDANYSGLKWDDGGRNTPDWGAVHYIGTNIPLYGGDGVDTNVSSMVNRDVDSYVSVYYNSGYHGPCAF